MTRSKDTMWVAGTAVLALLALVATYFLLIAPKRAEAADLATQTVTVEQSNAAIEQKTAQLKSQFETLDEKKAELAAIRATLPAQADVPALLRQLETYATSSGATLVSVTPGTPQVASSTDPAATTVPNGVVSIPLTLSTTGSFAETELLLKNVQADMGRYFLVGNVSLQSGDAQTVGTVTGTISGQVFVLQDSSSQAATTTDTVTADATTGSSIETETAS